MRHRSFLSKTGGEILSLHELTFHIVDALDVGIKIAAEQNDTEGILQLADKMIEVNDRFLSIMLNQEEEVEEDEQPKPKPVPIQKQPVGFDTARAGEQDSSNGKSNTVP